ncbi:MAG TPA: selenide, water dikinase SelD [Acidimicrobiia bacterium]|nr:selenide, water dikinase SelD [Acidimicrobiia bacterium]
MTTTEPRLTSYSHGAGCACKLAPYELAEILGGLDDAVPVTAPDLIVGIESSDDAGVYRLRDDLAIVQTVDFFTPIVDEPEDWGRITAANALSDIYAMGATPLTVLQIVAWPRDSLPFSLLSRVIGGAGEVLRGAGVTIVGGHSVDDPEPKYGMAVTGVVDPGRILRNRGARDGDAIVVTKPIGTGLVSTAIKRGIVDAGDRDAAVRSMVRLNDAAGAAAVEAGASAATDVTGFGLLGHLGEMLGEVGARIEASTVPLLPGARGLADEGVVPGGTRRNLRHAESFTDFGDADESTRILLADAQTSGGLLVALPPDSVDQFVTSSGAEAWMIGRFTSEHPGRVEVVA